MDSVSKVELVGDDVIIERLVVHDSGLRQFLEGVPASEYAVRVKDALVLGAEVLQKARTKSETDYIDKRFAEVSKDFGERLNEVIAGTTKGLNELVTGTRGELAKLLNPRDGSSPFKERFESLDALLERIKGDLVAEYTKVQGGAATLAAQFDPSGNEETSHLAKLKSHIAGFEARVKQLFDPEHANSYFKQLTMHLDGVFNPKSGSLPGLLDQRLTFEKTDSPFGLFRKEVAETLGQMREKVIESIGGLKAELEAYRAQVGQAASDREKMSAKGDDFEDAALDLLTPFAQKRGDTVERVGTTAESGSSKKGDLNYRFSANAGLVAIEAKNKKVSSIRGFTDELLAAVRNRNAGFGILLVRDAEHLPKSLGEWHFDTSADGVGYIITHAGMIEVSLKFAHARLSYAAAEVAGVDVSTVRVLINAVSLKLKEASAIRGNLTALETTIDKIREQLSGIVDAVEGHMEQIGECIAAAKLDGS